MAHSAQELVDAFLLQVGACITQWADLEAELFEICLACLACTPERGAIVYYRTPTIGARLSLVDELLHTALPQRERTSGGHDHPDLKLWTKIKTQVSEALKTRNRIAHQPMAPKTIVDPFHILANPPYKPWFEIYVSHSEQYRKEDAGKPPLRLEDLKSHYRTVLRLRAALRAFRSQDLAKHVVASPPPDPQPR